MNDAQLRALPAGNVRVFLQANTWLADATSRKVMTGILIIVFTDLLKRWGPYSNRRSCGCDHLLLVSLSG
jgi:hypothetical protein